MHVKLLGDGRYVGVGGTYPAVKKANAGQHAAGIYLVERTDLRSFTEPKLIIPHTYALEAEYVTPTSIPTAA